MSEVWAGTGWVGHWGGGTGANVAPDFGRHLAREEGEAMQRMYGIDPMFIYSETPESPMEVSFTCVFDPATAPNGYSFDAVRQHMTQRVPDIPLLRRRLIPVPLGLDHPRWFDDPEFDIDNHLHRTRLADPGGDRSLSTMTAGIM